MDSATTSAAGGIGIAPRPDAEANLFLPPGRLRRYQLSKLAGAAVVGGIFIGWLILQWHHLPMRLAAIGLLAVTVYVTVKSMVSDYLRARGRQVALEGGELVITRQGKSSRVKLQSIAEIHWREADSSELGLWLMDAQGQPLEHLEEAFVQDQREARAFLGWLRRVTGMNWPTRWP